MMKLLCFIKRLMSCPVVVMAGIALISAFSLAAAYIAEYVYGLEPCILCLYQRVPFAMALVLSLIGLVKKSYAVPVIIASGGAFAVNAMIAFYHSGVERKWWPSHLEGCAVPDLGDNPAAMLETIMNAPAVRCDEIPWADPVLGLSMANYNVALCAGLALICILNLDWYKRKP